MKVAAAKAISPRRKALTVGRLYETAAGGTLTTETQSRRKYEGRR